MTDIEEPTGSRMKRLPYHPYRLPLGWSLFYISSVLLHIRASYTNLSQTLHASEDISGHLGRNSATLLLLVLHTVSELLDLEDRGRNVLLELADSRQPSSWPVLLSLAAIRCVCDPLLSCWLLYRQASPSGSNCPRPLENLPANIPLCSLIAIG